MKTHTLIWKNVQTKSLFSAAKLLIVTVVLTTLVACGGGRKAPVDPETGNTVSDITQPPQTIVGRQDEVQVRDPEETVSFDEWRKRRLEEQRRLQQQQQTLETP